MTSAVTGKSGVVNIGGVVSEVTTWSMNRTNEPVDATSMSSSGNKEFVSGLNGFTGSFTTLAFLNKLGSQAAATFQVGAAASAANPKYSGAIIITDEPVTVDVAGVVNYSYTFTGTGVCTAATA